MHLYTINEYQPGRKYLFDRQQESEWHPDIVEPEFWEMAEQVWDYTALATVALYNYWTAIKYVLKANIPGALVECGVYFGGSVMFAAETLKRGGATRPLYALDTFSGFTENDARLDKDYSGNVVCEPSRNGGNFLERSTSNMKSTAYGFLKVVEGDIFETIPKLGADHIAILRLDTDTANSTKFELENLHSQVVRGGVVIIDDYGFNVGCATAVEEFVADKGIMVQRHDRWVRSWVKP
jgi:O-methyltransferase